MGQRAWWGGVAGLGAGLAMLACALALAGHGQRACLRPFSVLALPALAHAAAVVKPPALAPGVMFHEAVAALMGLLGVRFISSWMLLRAVPLWIVGGGLSMEIVDRAVLAWRAPEMPVMLTGAQPMPYLACGAVLAAMVHGPRLVEVALVTGSGPPFRRAVPARTMPRGAVLDRPVLQVLIAPHCFGCDRARHLAAETQARFPGLTVRVVDLGQSAAPLPRGVVAVPAYVLDGRLLFTGNPTAEALARVLAKAVAEAGIIGLPAPPAPRGRAASPSSGAAPPRPCSRTHSASGSLSRAPRRHVNMVVVSLIHWRRCSERSAIISMDER